MGNCPARVEPSRHKLLQGCFVEQLSCLPLLKRECRWYLRLYSKLSEPKATYSVTDRQLWSTYTDTGDLRRKRESGDNKKSRQAEERGRERERRE